MSSHMVAIQEGTALCSRPGVCHVDRPKPPCLLYEVLELAEAVVNDHVADLREAAVAARGNVLETDAVDVEIEAAAFLELHHDGSGWSPLYVGVPAVSKE